MPTPVAHSIVSLALSGSKPERVRGLKKAAFWVLLGNFADLDFIPGCLIGDPSRFHHGFTHSLLFAVMLSAAGYYFYPRMFRERAPFWVFLSVAISHLVLDCLTLDTVAPFGLPLLWPFQPTYYRFPFSFFLNVNRAWNMRILFSWHNFVALSLEIVLTLPFFLWSWFARYRGRTYGLDPLGSAGERGNRGVSN